MKSGSLVAYSDSEDDEPGADSAPPAVPVAPPAASTSLPTAAPPAKRPRMEVDLQALLQKHDVALPFEEAAKLPADFFDGGSTAIEPDAGKSAPKGGGGWSALSSLLPAPKNAGKVGVKSASSLFANAKPLVRKASAAAAAPSVSPAEIGGAGPSGATWAEEEPGLTRLTGLTGLTTAADEPYAHASGSRLAAPTAAPQLLRPTVHTSLYESAPPACTGLSSAALTAAPDVELSYDVPAGPARGPPVDSVDSAVEGYDEAVAGYGGYDLSNGRVVDVDPAALRKIIGQSRQYDFVAPPPPQETKIAANFWSRTSGDVVQQYQPSSLQKRKHQINSLAAQAAAQASDVALRSSKSMKSKKETAAKYGW